MSRSVLEATALSPGTFEPWRAAKFDEYVGSYPEWQADILALLPATAFFF